MVTISAFDLLTILASARVTMPLWLFLIAMAYIVYTGFKLSK